MPRRPWPPTSTPTQTATEPTPLHEVPGGGQQLQAGARYASGELAATLRRNPRVVLAPDDELRNGDPAIERLDLLGVALVGLGDLPIERRLADRT